MNDLGVESEFQAVYVKTEELIQEGRAKFSPKSSETLETLSYWWWSLDKLGSGRIAFGEEVKPETMYLGRVVASVFLNAVAEADDWFDQNKNIFLAANASDIRSSLRGFHIGGNQTFPITLGDVIELVGEYIQLMTDGQQKDLAKRSLEEFLDIPFRALEWEVSGAISTYGYEEAFEHKKKTLESYMDLGYALGAGDNFDGRYLEWNKKVILALQVDDDIRDFEEDLGEGTVNVMVGFYHERLDRGVGDERARKLARRDASRFAVMQKLESYYPYWLFRNFIGPFVVSKATEIWSKTRPSNVRKGYI